MDQNLIFIILTTGLISSILSLSVKLIYDGIKAKKNGNGKVLNNGRVSVNLELLAKDVDFSNLRLTEIERNINKLVELLITSKEQTNTHWASLKSAVNVQTNMLSTFIDALKDKV